MPITSLGPDYGDEARAMAVRAAREKAEALARQLGLLALRRYVPLSTLSIAVTTPFTDRSDVSTT